MLSLRNTLLVNAISSGATGAILLIFAQQAADLFTVTSSLPFTGTGLFLIAFAAFVLSTALTKNTPSVRVKVITLLDISWVIASVLLVVSAGASLSMAGNALIIAVAGWVSIMAFLQSRGLRLPKAEHL